MLRTATWALFLFILVSSCTVSRYGSPKKWGSQQLQKDYSLFRNIIEESHPGLYWYMPKGIMDARFAAGSRMLKDSMTEQQFRTVLSYVISGLGCGHTSVRASKKASRTIDTLRRGQFPLAFKIWKDTAVVLLNLNAKDTVVRRGVIVTSINGMPMQLIVDSLFAYLSTDGYNLTHKYQTLSNRGTFGSLYLSVFGYRNNFAIGFLDSAGRERSANIRLYIPAHDTGRVAAPDTPRPHITRRQRKKRALLGARSMVIDTSLRTAFMELNTFQKSARLRPFFRASFKKMERAGARNLVIDLRTNGGGNVTNSNLLTKYIAAQPFRIADSLYTRTRRSKYARYQQNHLLNSLFGFFMTRRKGDGNYHFGYYERKEFAPKKKHHFSGTVYVLSGGNTFSASTLFIKSLIGQSNVTLVGEETGGGAYGNNAWLIPNVTLPLTGVRFRLPLYRLVIDRNEKKGFGVQPEIFAIPTVEAIRKNRDLKMAAVLQSIRASR
jgi:hypothetical protein